MKKAIILIIFSIIFISSVSAAVTQIGFCQTIGSPGMYNLSGNLIPNSTGNPCIKIQAQNVSFNCNGFIIGGNTTFNNYLVQGQTSPNVTISNCVFNGSGMSSSSSAYSITLSSVINYSLINDTFMTGYVGIFNDGSNGTYIKNVTIQNCTSQGMRFATKGKDILVVNSNISCPLLPFSTDNYDNLTVFNSTISASGSSADVITITSTKYNNSGILFSFNTIRDSSGAGVRINYSSNVTFWNNNFINTTTGYVYQIQNVSGGTIAERINVTQNIFWNTTWLGNAGNMIRIDAYDNNSVYIGNVFHNIFLNRGNGRLVQFQGGSGNRLIANNIMIDNINSSEYIGLDSTANYNPDDYNINSTIINNSIRCGVLTNSTKGILMYRLQNGIVANNTIYQCQYGILFTNESTYNNATGNNVSSCDNGEVVQEGAMFNIFDGDWVNASVTRALLVTMNNITSIQPTNNTWIHMNIQGQGITSEGIRFTSETAGLILTSPNYLKDSIINVTSNPVVAINNNSGGFLINVSYTGATAESVSDRFSSFYREWYYQGNVTNSTSLKGIESANVTLWNNTGIGIPPGLNTSFIGGSVFVSLLTDVNGMTNVTVIPDYYKNSTDKYYFSLWGVDAQATGYRENGSEMFNSTTKTNFYQWLSMNNPLLPVSNNTTFTGVCNSFIPNFQVFFGFAVLLGATFLIIGFFGMGDGGSGNTSKVLIIIGSSLAIVGVFLGVGAILFQTLLGC